jgi:hypothetical protein
MEGGFYEGDKGLNIADVYQVEKEYQLNVVFSKKVGSNFIIVQRRYKTNGRKTVARTLKNLINIL